MSTSTIWCACITQVRQLLVNKKHLHNRTFILYNRREKSLLSKFYDQDRLIWRCFNTLFIKRNSSRRSLIVYLRTQSDVSADIYFLPERSKKARAINVLSRISWKLSPIKRRIRTHFFVWIFNALSPVQLFILFLFIGIRRYYHTAASWSTCFFYRRREKASIYLCPCAQSAITLRFLVS